MSLLPIHRISGGWLWNEELTNENLDHEVCFKIFTAKGKSLGFRNGVKR